MIETFGRGALDYALAKPGSVVALLPSTGADAALAIFRAPRKSQPVPQQQRSLSPKAEAPEIVAAYARHEAANRVTRAGGFLGLSDEPVIEEPVEEKKGGWWKRFWDE